MTDLLRKDILQHDLTRFETELRKQLASSVAFIEAIGEDLARAGGKRLRPHLSFLAGRVLGTDPELSLRVALTVELLHSASLLHDDLIDDADTRRGAEAAFRRYGNVVSVMSGDFLLARALGLLADSGNAELTRLMARTAAAVCEGEVLQFQIATMGSFTFETYERIIDGKTALLIAAAMQGVAILAEAPEAEARALRDFGLHYGRSFQMQDDYLDLLGDADTLGKPVGGDLREGKATYPVLLLLLEHGVTEASDIVRRHASGPGDVERMVALVREHGTDAATRKRIVDESRRAVRALDVFSDSPAKRQLVALSEQEFARAS